MILTDEQVFALTKRKRRGAQSRMLSAMGIDHKPRPGACPAVLHAHVVHLLGGEAPAKVRKPFVLDWSARDAEAAQRKK